MNNQPQPNPVEASAQPPQPANTGKPKRGISDVIFYVASTLAVLLLAAIAIPNFMKARTTASKNACFNNLRQIDGAKEQWALETKKTPTDTPTWDDLVGTDKYIKVMPTCPANGSYTPGSMSVLPACSLLVHTLDVYYSREGSVHPTITCQQSLDWLRIAKQAWLSANAGQGLPSEKQLLLLIKQESKAVGHPQPPPLKCEAGGKFIIGNLNDAPRCSIPGHTLF